MDNNDDDDNDNDDDDGRASLSGPARDSSSLEEFTLLSHPKKQKASSPQPSHPTLSKHVKGSVFSQPMVSLKGKEPVRTSKMRSHYMVSPPIDIHLLDGQHPPSLLPLKGPKTLFNDNDSLEDTTRNNTCSHSDTYNDAQELPDMSTGEPETFKIIQQPNLLPTLVNAPIPSNTPASVNAPTLVNTQVPLLPALVDAPKLVNMPVNMPMLANVPTLVNMSMPVNVPAPVNAPTMNGSLKLPSIHITQQSFNALP